MEVRVNHQFDFPRVDEVQVVGRISLLGDNFIITKFLSVDDQRKMSSLFYGPLPEIFHMNIESVIFIMCNFYYTYISVLHVFVVDRLID